MKKKNLPLSIEQKPVTPIQPQLGIMLQAPDSSGNRFYQTIDELPLNRFIICICKHDLSVLIISGVVQLKILQETWFPIYMDFIERSEDGDVMQIMRLTREVYKLRNQKLKVEQMVDFLKVQWDEDFVNELRKMNFRYKFDPLRVKEYSRDLKLIITRLIEWEIKIDLYESEIEAIQKKNAGGDIETIYFTKRLVILGRFFKFHIDTKIITAGEYLAYWSEYTKYCKDVEVENKKQIKK